MRKFVITLLVAMVAVCSISSAVLSSNNLSIEVRGYMAPASSFYLEPTTEVNIDLDASQGKQIPIATYAFNTNSVKDTTLIVSPSNSDQFNLVGSGNASEYPYEIAVCSFDSFGNIIGISQTATTNVVNIRSGEGDVSSHGEIYACFPIYDQDDATSESLARGVKDDQYSSELYFNVVIV